jgi:hypothetical protein
LQQYSACFFNSFQIQHLRFAYSKTSRKQDFANKKAAMLRQASPLMEAEFARD